MPKRPVVLTIAGSDSSGGAGIQADLKTFCALGVYGASVLTALTAQNTTGVSAVHQPDAGFLLAQCDAVFEDLDVAAVKIGMLGNVDAIDVVATVLGRYRPPFVVLDPVMVATSGDRLLDEAAERALREQLLPVANLTTPNLAESAALLGQSLARSEDEVVAQAQALQALGSQAVLLKGGHSTDAEAKDLLLTKDGARFLSAPRIATHNTHGTGCTLSAAIAALWTLDHDLVPSVELAKAYLTRALAAADALELGHGAGPVDHLYGLEPGPRG